MLHSRHFRTLAAGILAACASGVVAAGGPLYVYDPVSKTPGAWPPGVTPVFLDLGPLGRLTNAEAESIVAFAIGQWNAVPTSSFQAAIAGDFASIGLPDIDATNLFDVLEAWNGGGIHIIYDSDGSIMESFFGPDSGVLGFTLVEYVDDTSPAILEVTIALNGLRVPAAPLPVDVAMARYAGVVTHEMGHAINLTHSQTNGQLYFFFEPWAGPEECSDAFSRIPSPAQLETMYPFARLSQTGIEMSTVDLLDDRSTVSNLYPDAGWPASYPTIRGTIRVPGRGRRTSEYTGANVIARNVADPLGDAISAISGDYSQGAAGPDGTYTFNGLTPGASYHLYIDGILLGFFSTPSSSLLPGPEEYFNGARESGDGITDDRCEHTAIPVAAGRPYVANITFNRVKGAPVFYPIELPLSFVSDVSGDGRVAVGASLDGVFRWTGRDGPAPIGGSPFSFSPGISEDGRTIVAEIVDSTTWGRDVNVAAVWQGGERWSPIGTIRGGAPCDADLSSARAAATRGNVVGVGYKDCTSASAYEWTRAGGISELRSARGAAAPGSGANAISANGRTIVGWDGEDSGLRRGARWDRGGRAKPIKLATPQICDSDPASSRYLAENVGAANGINASGSAIVGEQYPVPRDVDTGAGEVTRYCDEGAWLWTESTGVRWLGEFEAPGYRTAALDVSDDGKVVTGIAESLTPGEASRSLLWTEATGAIDFQEFLVSQGTWAPGWALSSLSALSGDGRTAAGVAVAPYLYQGFVVKMPKVVICHHSKVKPDQPGRMRTIDVAFPDALDHHLAHGDTIGICGNGL